MNDYDRQSSVTEQVGVDAGADKTERRPLISRGVEPDNLESPMGALSSFLTPVDQFYVRNHFSVPHVDPESWRLKVEGCVHREITLSMRDIETMPAVSLPAMLECAGNGRWFLRNSSQRLQWFQGAVSTAEWTGVRLADVLEMAGLLSQAREVVLVGLDSGHVEPDGPRELISFSRSLPLEKARDPHVLLAYRMNKEELTPSHGFPLRAVVPGWYGMASVKWLSRIVVVDHDYQGYFQSTDYTYWTREAGLVVRRPIAEVLVKAIVISPEPEAIVPADSQVTITGAAWAGESDIVKVEISTDGGKSWADACLQGEPTRYCWTHWRYLWRTPELPGVYQLVARATDSKGNTQPENRDPNRGTYLINHLCSINVTVSKGPDKQ